MKENHLHNTKESGFKIPDEYFDNLEDDIFNNIALKSRVNNSGFKMPENYLETLEETILSKVNKEPKVISLFNKRHVIYISSIAAALVIMFNVFNNNGFQSSLDSIETDSIVNYLEDEGLNNSDYASLLSDEDLESFSYSDSNIDEDTLESYLLENTNLEDIIEQ